MAPVLLVYSTKKSLSRLCLFPWRALRTRPRVFQVGPAVPYMAAWHPAVASHKGVQSQGLLLLACVVVLI